jgi:putative PIN family toxin of toxin-antitoxin system
VRAVLDANVLVSAAISTRPPRQIVAAWVEGRFELVASPTLLGELRDVLTRPKLRPWISPALAHDFVDGLAEGAVMLDDSDQPRPVSPDPEDDYLVELARAAAADYLVSGDRHLLGLGDPTPPVLTPRQFLDRLSP